MSVSAASLDRLHDIVQPPAVPWWPPAPGWYVVIAIALTATAWLALRLRRRWQANAYRRAALHELKSLETPAAIAELLRRTALAVSPRSSVAEKTGSVWLDWLAAQLHEPMPESVRVQLTTGVYGRSSTTPDLTHLRAYATRWITSHRSPITDH
jgi:hypothetical protein